MRFYFLILTAIMGLAAAIYPPPSQVAEADAQNREYHIIAAYLYNFTQFTTWPKASTEDGFSICVLGRNPFGELLTPLRNKTAQGAKISVRYYKAMESGVTDCDVLFVSDSEGNAQSIAAALKAVPVLTMSNISRFAEVGGMVEFVKEDTKIAIHINNRAAQHAELSISSKLLSLAHIVE